MAALHMRYHWTGGETTMVVEWVDPARHRRDRGDEGAYVRAQQQRYLLCTEMH